MIKQMAFLCCVFSTTAFAQQNIVANEIAQPAITAMGKPDGEKTETKIIVSQEDKDKLKLLLEPTIKMATKILMAIKITGNIFFGCPECIGV